MLGACRLALLVCLSLSALTHAKDPGPAPSVRLDEKNATIEFRVNKDLVARYHHLPSLPKPYFFPLMAPGQLGVTRAVPPASGDATDHPHQVSAWFCHGDVIPEGIELKHRIKGVKGVDFWSIHEGHGKIVCKSVHDREGGVETYNEWQTADGVKILDEKRIITLQATEGAYLFVLDIDLFASVCPITFGDTKEGSLGIRVSNPMTEKLGKGKLTNAEGKTGMKAIWGQHSKWCDYSGPISRDENAPVAGITLFDHPGNKYPAAWHARDYGLMAANPFGRAAFPGTKENPKLVRLDKGEHLKLRYGILLHRGDVKEGKVAEVYAKFAEKK